MIESLLITAALAVFAWLFLQDYKKLRSDLESRLTAIEKIQGEFARNLAKAGPVPLKRVLTIGIHLDAKFWRDTLSLAPSEMEDIQRRLFVPNMLGAPEAGMFSSFHYTLCIRIQEWRGGYRQVTVEQSLPESSFPTGLGSAKSNEQREKIIELYPTGSHDTLWIFKRTSNGSLFDDKLFLELGNGSIKLRGWGQRFGRITNKDYEWYWSGYPYLDIPHYEGPEAERFFKQEKKKIDRKAWTRFYEHSDDERGIAWQLKVEDCDLHARSQGVNWEAVELLLADWKERFYRSDEVIEWHRRIAEVLRKSIQGEPDKDEADDQHGPRTEPPAQEPPDAKDVGAV